jgi:hypothetical protein
LIGLATREKRTYLWKIVLSGSSLRVYSMKKHSLVGNSIVIGAALMLAGCGVSQSSQEDLNKSRLGEFVIHSYEAEDGQAAYDAANHTFATLGGHFAVFFPAEPGAIPESYSIRRGKRLLRITARNAHRFILPDANLDLMVSEYPDDRIRTDDVSERRAELNRVCTGAVHDFRFVESARHPIRMSKDNAIEGIEAEGTLAHGQDQFRMQVFADKDGRIYRLIAAGPAQAVTGIDANQFFDSLSVSDNEIAQLVSGHEHVANADSGYHKSIFGNPFRSDHVVSATNPWTPEAHVYKAPVGRKTYIMNGQIYSGSADGTGLIVGPGGVFVKDGPGPMVHQVGGGGGQFGGFGSRHF